MMVVRFMRVSSLTTALTRAAPLASDVQIEWRRGVECSAIVRTFRSFSFPLLRLVGESHIVFAGQVSALVNLIQLTNPARVGRVATATANHRARQGS
jgi:hypothetical protein